MHECVCECVSVCLNATELGMLIVGKFLAPSVALEVMAKHHSRTNKQTKLVPPLRCNIMRATTNAKEERYI